MVQTVLYRCTGYTVVVVVVGSKCQCVFVVLLQETCRYCKEDWAEHIGIPCEELEKKDETKIRLAL